MIPRLLNPSKSSSLFLFGARGTGKSTFLKNLLKDSALYFDLLDTEIEDRYLTNPKNLERDILEKFGTFDWVVIDEIQKVPNLLNHVHRLIESKKIKFALTGSSARKLKREGVNLLAGRAFVYHLFPFTQLELAEEFNLIQALHFGTLPRLLELSTDRDKIDYLRSYSLTYLREEVRIEQLVRKLEPFRNFLGVAAQMSGKVVNASKIGKEIDCDHKTVQNYFSILEDTWLGFSLPAFHKSIRKSQLVSPKFYLFDLGVRNALAENLDSKPSPGTSYFGDLFEQFVILEIFRMNHYTRKDFRLSYFLNKHGTEIDLILSKGKDDILVEIKSSPKISEDEVRRLAQIAADFKQAKQIYYICRDTNAVKIEGVRCCSYEQFIKEVFDSEAPVNG